MTEAERTSTRRRLLGGLGRICGSPSVRSAFFAFTLTRLLILFVILLSANLKFESHAPDQFGEIHEAKISLRNVGIADVLRRVTLGADSLWIINIARDGYEKMPF